MKKAVWGGPSREVMGWLMEAQVNACRTLNLEPVSFLRAAKLLSSNEANCSLCGIPGLDSFCSSLCHDWDSEDGLDWSLHPGSFHFVLRSAVPSPCRASHTRLCRGTGFGQRDLSRCETWDGFGQPLVHSYSWRGLAG